MLKEKRNEILRICAKYGAKSIRVFGSVAKDGHDEESGIDFLVELEPGRTLLDLGGIQFDLEEFLGCYVDVVTPKSPKSCIRERVLQESIELLHLLVQSRFYCKPAALAADSRLPFMAF